MRQSQLFCLTLAIPFVWWTQDVNSLSAPHLSQIATERSDSYQQEQQRHSRRAFGKVSCGILGCLTITGTQQPAEAVSNPLNLKGSFWETGELYKKDDQELSTDPAVLLEYLRRSVKGLLSLSDVITDGNLEEASRLLRGGLVSESQLRLQAYALIDMIDDEEKEYVASEKFRTFLVELDLLDRGVEASMRQKKIDGGAIETLGRAVVNPFGAANQIARIANEPANFGNDPRILVLAQVDETAKALKDFADVAEKVLQ